METVGMHIRMRAGFVSEYLFGAKDAQCLKKKIRSNLKMLGPRRVI
jgi:hypothetical protein